MEFAQAKECLDRVVQNISGVILGKEDEVRQALTCWLAGGHVLFEDVPGTGKTILARSMARSVGCKTTRVQFTPDLLPNDIIGSSIYARETGEFKFVPGPVFTAVLLADEINRATPRTQSALLQAMAERQCTADNKTYRLPETFFVIATQNPVEQHGTFPLPEAQLDRFMMRLSLGYPDQQSEIRLVQAQLLEHPVDALNPVATEEQWLAIKQLVRQVRVSPSAIEYAFALVAQTRLHQELALGASPRATIALIRCGQAYSLMMGLDYIKPDYIKMLAPAVLEHRIVLTTKARLQRMEPKRIIFSLVNSIKVPTQ